jgi:hypothetical protein
MRGFVIKFPFIFYFPYNFEFFVSVPCKKEILASLLFVFKRFLIRFWDNKLQFWPERLHILNKRGQNQLICYCRFTFLREIKILIYVLTLKASISKEVFDNLPLCQMFTRREHCNSAYPLFARASPRIP